MYSLFSLSVNVGESMITQSSKVRDLGVIFDQFLNFDCHITAICRSTHFYIRNIGKIRNLLSYDACSTIILIMNSMQTHGFNPEHHLLLLSFLLQRTIGVQ